MSEFLSNLGALIASSQGKNITQGVPIPRVVDKTGLTGRYTFILEFYDPGMPDLGSLMRRGAPNTADPANAPTPVASEPGSSLPNIFDAVQKQLGLRLDKTPDVPVNFIVVDSVDKTPTPD